MFVPVEAAVVMEAGDAPELLPGQDVTDAIPTGGGLQILGSHSDQLDVDLYRINIVDPASFSAKTFGADALDTHIFLFDENGVAIAGNDDRADFGEDCAKACWSELTGVPGLGAGIHFIAVSQYPIVPFSATGSIFSLEAGENIVPFVGLALPTGPGGGGSLASWQNPFGFFDPLIPDYTLELISMPEPPCDGLGGDTDGDTLCDDVDPCQSFSNTLPLVISGLSGIPDECLCGDFDGNGSLSATDAAAVNGCAGFVRFDCVEERDEVSPPYNGFYSATDASLINRVGGFVDPAYTLICGLRPEGTCGGDTGVSCF